MTKPTIAIVGAGNQGTALAKHFDTAGYRVVFGSRDPAKGERIAGELGGAITGGTITDAVAAGDIVVLAVPYAAMGEAVAATGPMEGKIVVDVSNPFTSDFNGLSVGHTFSAAEELQNLLPKARVVKAFNLFFASWLDEDKYGGSAKYKSLHAGNDEAAKQTIADLAAAIGFDPVDAGALERARLLEPLALLVVKVGYDNLVREVTPPGS